MTELNSRGGTIRIRTFNSTTENHPVDDSPDSNELNHIFLDMKITDEENSTNMVSESKLSIDGGGKSKILSNTLFAI